MIIRAHAFNSMILFLCNKLVLASADAVFIYKNYTVRFIFI